MKHAVELQQELRTNALTLLIETDPAAKASQTRLLFDEFKKNVVALDTKLDLDILTLSAVIPGRPQKPALVSPLSVKKRSMRTPEGRAALIHAIAHIEFNAINLALDAIWRFADMPVQMRIVPAGERLAQGDHAG